MTLLANLVRKWASSQSGVAAAHHQHLLALVEEAVAGGAGGDAADLGAELQLLGRFSQRALAPVAMMRSRRRRPSLKVSAKGRA